ncbi:hypothetical protein [Pelagicoccus sp. SDUM812003]|uniref:hypothetical protein n=1 Tax=Pelagicoccus sp. SDUM812003 TaxID=3041267 RepID=UPI00280FE4B0|nr:hypothetical protein [Pelagicoccus sp. SDUM812003]MDQ8203515.1 hypothetical protein [Pelagicoccus sp. SDUM812003]
MRTEARNLDPRWPNPLFSSLVVSLVAFVASFLILPSGRCFTSDPKTVDLSTALKFDGYAVSQYIVDKNYNLFLSSAPQPPSTREKSEWFTRFIAEQCLIAELRKEGWSERPEVALAVDSMERYLLIQDDSPVLKRTVPTIPIHPEKLEETRLQAKTKVTGIFIELDAAESTSSLQDFKALSELESYITREERPGSKRSVASLNWPFNPHMSIREEISKAETGKLYGPFSHLGTLLYFQLTAKESSSTLYDHLHDASFSEHASLIDRAVRLEKYKYLLKDQAQLRIQGQLLPTIAQSLSIDDRGKLSLADRNLGNSRLFEYRLDESVHPVSVNDFIADYNHAIQRQLLDHPDKIERAIDFYVLSRLCLRLGRSGGMTSEPRFSQNRLNYENNCMLEAYKAELFEGEGRIRETEIMQGFQQRYSDMTKASRIEGTLLIFDSWKSFSDGNPPSKSRPNLQVTEDSPPITDAWPNRALLALADGARTGPAPYYDGVAIFEKAKTLELRSVTLEELRPRLEREIKEERFLELISKDVQQRARKLGLRLQMDFSRYGLKEAPTIP